MSEEPSVLDYLKAKLIPWRHSSLEFPSAQASFEPSQGASLSSAATAPLQTAEEALQPKTSIWAISWPWRNFLALVLALLAQRALEPRPDRTWTAGAIFFGLAAGWLVWANWRGEWSLAPLRQDERSADPFTIHLTALLIGLPLAIGAYLTFGGNLFTPLNLLLWYLAFVFIFRAFWLGDLNAGPLTRRLRAFISRPNWQVSISRWSLLLVAVMGLAVFFRAYHLAQVPPEMNSDHAEKLLDVYDVLHGQTHIFFPRNTGREAIQFYLTAAIARFLGTGISFISLKIGTLLAGLVTLPFIYLLGKEIGNQEVGLLATAFTAVAYWPNVIGRIALRFALYPLFVAPILYFLIRGIRRSNRNDFILSGIALGIGLHGYTPIRIMPFVVVIAVGVYLLHRQSSGVRKKTLIYLGLLALISLVLFLPLMRYAQENPEIFAYRSFTRLTDWERPLPGPAWQIFLHNLWNAMISFNWDNGEVWTTSIPHRPALGIVSGALFVLGMVLLFVRYLRKRHWLDIFLILSVPLLMLPSILSLAFPSENPVLSRTGGAIIPVFLMIGLALEGLLSQIRVSFKPPVGDRLAAGLALVLLGWSAFQNYNLVFTQYAQEYALSSWNTSEMGQVIRDFADTIGSPDNAWVVGYPYWVDTRLVGMTAGYPTKDFVILADQLQETLADPGAKLFLVNLEDAQAVTALRQLYPRGSLKEYQSKTETKDFLMFFVPPD
jgi:4-amino-4-deoxy-L-arabinose transferase-like glycosyltransferase